MRKLLLLFAVSLTAGLQVAVAQSRPVKGKVLDEKGEGIPGASVKIKGTTQGTVTDVDGNFALDVPDDDEILIIESIGSASQEVKAGDGDQSLVINLLDDTKTLQETVITALGITKDKRTLGYSTSKVGADQIEASGERNAIQSLAGKAPGINVVSSAGLPGASSKISIRGNSSFTGNNSPLVVIDGVPVDNSTSQPTGADNPFNANLSGVNESNRLVDMNPDDIESVTVLKGPAAATLYGSSGSNGAIIITTKKGKYGGKKGLGITYNSSIEWNKVSKLPEKQSTYAQGSGGRFVTGSTPLSWGPRMDTAGLQSYNNYDHFYQTGMGYNNTLAISGGNDNTIFRSSFANYTTKGIIPNSRLGRTNVTLNAETKLAEWLTVGGAANYSHTEGTMMQNGSNVAGSSLSLFRMPSSYDVRKNYFDPVTNTTENYMSAYDNPLFTAYRNPYYTFTNRIVGNMYLNATLAKNLTLSYKIGADAYATETKQIFDLGSRGNDASDGSGQVNKSNTNYLQVYSDLILKYTKRVGDYNIGGMLGYNYWYSENRYNFLRGSKLSVPNLYNLTNASDLYASNSDGFNRIQALFGELNLSYKAFLYFNVTGRNEWNTAFAADNNSYFFSNANLSWVFSEHIERNDVLSYGKLRLATSKAALGPSLYSDRNYYSKPFLTDGNTNGNGFPYLGQNGYMMPNVNFPGGLRPETVSGKEIGLELRFWRDRISLDATYYNQVSNDLLLVKPVAPSSGFQSEYINAGKMRNFGVELALSVDVYKNRDWNINIGFNWAKNVSEVLELDKGVEEISLESGFSSIGSYAIVGQPYGVFYGSAWKRNASGQLLIDDDGYPIIDNISKNLGNPNPDWLMGITGNFSYKGFTLNMLWDIRHGGKIWNGTASRLNNVGIAKETEDREHDFVVPGVYEDGTPNATAIPAVDYWRYYKGDLGATENAIQDGGWVRLRSISLSYRYSFKNTNSSKNPFKYVELGFTGRNLILSTKYTGVDPETSLTGAGSNIGGWDYFNNPGAKSYMVNFKFGL
jgi:TonB-linked SusC/RagA family outer membrane protein